MAMSGRFSGARRRPILQNNGAPIGYGQRSGASPYLDREQPEPQPEEPQQLRYNPDIVRYSTQTPEENEEAYRRGEFQRTKPERERYEQEDEDEPSYIQALSGLERDSERRGPIGGSSLFNNDTTQDRMLRPAVQDQWGRSPANPNYNRDPNGFDGPKGSAPPTDETGLSDDYSVPRDLLSDGYTIGGSAGAGGYSGITSPNGGQMPTDRKWTMDDLFAGGYLDDLEDDEPGPGSPDAPSAASSSNMPQGSMWGEDYRFLGAEGVPAAQDFGYGDTSRVRGFATNEWGPGGSSDYDEDSLKNFFGKLATRVDPGSVGARDALMAQPEFQQLFPNATAVSFDKIDFGDGSPVDVMINGRQDGSGEAWAFQTGAEGGEFAAGAGGDMSGIGPASSWDEGYAMISQLDPNMPEDEFQSTIEAIFGGLPGYGGAYKEAVMRDGDWKDMVGGYGAPGAKWQGFMSKGENAARSGGGHYGGSVGALSSPSSFSDPSFAGAASQLGLDGNQIQELLQQLLLQEEEQKALMNQTNAYLP